MGDVRRIDGDRAEQAAVTLDDLAREGARRMIAAALEVEVEEYVGSLVEEVGEDGKRLVVRNGRARQRRLTVGSGTVGIQAPRVNDRRVDEEGERKKFASKILPAYARRSPKVTDVLPILYLRGLSTGDFAPALRDLLGEDASGLSATSISRLTKQWEGDHSAFKARSLRFHRYAYLFLDGVHMSVRLGEDDRLCLLVVIGVREDGAKELLAGRGRLPGVDRLLVRGAARSARAWDERTEAGQRRRRPRRLGGAARRLPPGKGAEMLGPQDGQRPRRAPQAPAAQGEGAVARDGRGSGPRRCESGAGALPGGVRRQVPQGGGQARQGLDAAK
jgi:hypothetical protein